ncbi:glycine cleavage system protein H [Propionibacteriaceae bacterium Y1923]|uniref:glycine cleavage system protein H n=1 Tax=Aestuariimicrobium sp. Y1814 TaxID=3418742 RepID=UPI003C279820
MRYSMQHLWVRLGDGRELRVGGTDYWAETAGTVIHVSLPTVGAALRAGDECGELVGPNSSETVVAPVTGIVTAVNEALGSQPELVRADPYGAGWLFDVELAPTELVGELPLMDAEGYENFVGE